MSPIVGMMDIDGFNDVNEALGRPAGDQLLRQYLLTSARFIGASTVFTGDAVRELIRAQVPLEEVVLGRAFESGDELVVLHDDESRLASRLEELRAHLDELEFTVLSEGGQAVARLRGLPVSVGVGASWDEAWLRVVAAKKSVAKAPVAQRVLRLDGLIRDRPESDPETGLPTTIELGVEPSDRGPIPVLRWGPLVTRRPGWSAEHQQRLLRDLEVLLRRSGIDGPDEISARVEDVTRGTDTLWHALLERLRSRSSPRATPALEDETGPARK